MLKHVETTKAEVVTFLLEAFLSESTSGHRTAHWGLPPRQISVTPADFPQVARDLPGLNIFNLMAVTMGKPTWQMTYGPIGMAHTKKSRRSHNLAYESNKINKLYTIYLPRCWMIFSNAMPHSAQGECRTLLSARINMKPHLDPSFWQLVSMHSECPQSDQIPPGHRSQGIARDRDLYHQYHQYHPGGTQPQVPRSAQHCPLQNGPGDPAILGTPTTSLEATITKPRIYQIGRNRTKIGASWSLSLSLQIWHYCESDTIDY